jgi:invasion protein IalB
MRALVLVAMYLVFALSAARAADPRAMQLTYEPWAKACLGKSDCFIAAGARGTCSPSGGVIAINVANGKSASLSATFGTRHRLEGPIRVQIDQDTAILIPHVQCYPPSCTGKLEIDGGLIERLRTSRVITAEATNTAKRKMSLSFSLAGFPDAHDGSGSEPKVYEESQESLKLRLRERGLDNSPPPSCED